MYSIIFAVIMWQWCHCQPHTMAEMNFCRGSTEMTGNLKPCSGKKYEEGRTIDLPNYKSKRFFNK